MATPKQIATLLGLCAVSFGLFYASSLAEEQPIVLWGESAETTMAEKPGTDAPTEDDPTGDEPTETESPAATAGGKPDGHGQAKPTKPALAAAKPAAKAPVSKPGQPAAAKAPVTTAAKPEQKPAAHSKPAAAKPATQPSVAPAATPAPAQPVAVAVKPAPPASGAVNAPPLNPSGGRIPASTPQQLAAMAKQSSGRVDPFVSLELPAAMMSAAPAIKVTTPGGKVSPPKSIATPMPTPGDGMVVTGIITSAKESVAIVAADGRSRLVQVGDFLPGGIRVMSINPQGKAVIVSHGGRSARLAVKE